VSSKPYGFGFAFDKFRFRVGNRMIDLYWPEVKKSRREGFYIKANTGFRLNSGNTTYGFVLLGFGFGTAPMSTALISALNND